tara:strand:- start:5649 stop:5870 length:222 start_codon:yes stop_codon:yes gene_type:complete
MTHKHSDVVKAVEILDEYEMVEIADIIYDLAHTNPEAFIKTVEAIDFWDKTRIYEEMREETCNGYPMYPELQS